MFQSTRPRGARRYVRHTPSIVHHGFNPRARAGRDTARRNSSVLSGPFQSTRPRGARLLGCAAMGARSTSFNPRARAGRDNFFFEIDCVALIVSIHAPARGATP